MELLCLFNIVSCVYFGLGVCPNNNKQSYSSRDEFQIMYLIKK